ncbi:hypothetical protein GQ607_007341 [Colletotrichum asianum]|uniref:Secreted protein n=1 Tax=Colletotrichum asianum TaxID=702518 RepID=A0A8H3WIP9_9PEZI|nr:hypothetical protein GQ607_007341 [Colletotrichum asianum]
MATTLALLFPCFFLLQGGGCREAGVNGVAHGRVRRNKVGKQPGRRRRHDTLKMRSSCRCWDGQRTATFGVDFFLSKPRQGIPVVQPNRMFTVPANGPYVGDRSTGCRSRRPYQLGWSPGLGPSVSRRNVESWWPIHPTWQMVANATEAPSGQTEQAELQRIWTETESVSRESRTEARARGRWFK